jgi:hypothetical protein
MDRRIDLSFRTEPKGSRGLLFDYRSGRLRTMPARTKEVYVVENPAESGRLDAGSRLARRVQYVNASQRASSDSANELEWQIQLGSAEGSPKEDVMKRNLIGILSMVVMSIMMNATAQAQTVAKANVPFTFRVGSAQLPAGTYEIRAISDNVVAIRSTKSAAGALSLARRDPTQNTSSKLVFHHLAGEYFLTEIWGAPGTSGKMIPRSKQETNLEKELRAAGQPSAGEEILIALN